jgi:hypothetical protein
MGNIKATSGLLPLSAAVLAASISASDAGPCTKQVDRMQARIDAKVEAIAAAGPFLREGAFAGMGDQPTPRSIAAAEARRGEISWQTVDTVRQSMVRARAADAAGDGRACRTALAEVRRAMRR